MSCHRCDDRYTSIQDFTVLIFIVLNNAQKYKYPERHSALTYWEADTPSHINLGISDYGGPFTVNEVEDVINFFQLLPNIYFGGGFNAGGFNGRGFNEPGFNAGSFFSYHKLLDSEGRFDDFNLG